MKGVSQSIAARPATEQDRASVLALLEDANLPTDGLDEQFGEQYAVIEREGRVIAAGGVERYGAHDGLIRSVVVAADHRGERLGEAIVSDRLAWARRKGLRHLYLLTTTAGDWFPRFGFRRIARESVSPEIRTSREFAEACPASATVMRLDLGPRPEISQRPS